MTKDDAQTSLRLSSRLLGRTRALGDALALPGQSEVIRICLEAGVQQLENELIIGKATVAAAALEALATIRPGVDLGQPSLANARSVAERRDAAACRVVWRDAVAAIRAAAADSHDVDLAILESEIFARCVGRVTPIHGVNGWATSAVKELLGEERWLRLHAFALPATIPGLMLGYWFDNIEQAPKARPSYIPNAAYVLSTKDAERALDFVVVDDTWVPLSSAATFTYSHTTALQRGLRQVIVSWGNDGRRHEVHVVGINRLAPSSIASHYGRAAASLARKDHDAIELVFEAPLPRR